MQATIKTCSSGSPSAAASPKLRAQHADTLDVGARERVVGDVAVVAVGRVFESGRRSCRASSSRPRSTGSRRAGLARVRLRHAGFGAERQQDVNGQRSAGGPASARTSSPPARRGTRGRPGTQGRVAGRGIQVMVDREHLRAPGLLDDQRANTLVGGQPRAACAADVDERAQVAVLTPRVVAVIVGDRAGSDRAPRSRPDAAADRSPGRQCAPRSLTLSRKSQTIS